MTDDLKEVLRKDRNNRVRFEEMYTDVHADAAASGSCQVFLLWARDPVIVLVRDAAESQTETN